MKNQIPLLYTLYTDSYYGTEQMSLATAWGLRDQFNPIIITPPGPAANEARNRGFDVVETAAAAASGGMRTVNFTGLASVLAPYLASSKSLVFISTHTGHSLTFALLNLVYRRSTAHLFVMHGPPKVSRGVKNVLNGLPMSTVAISEYTRECLLSSGVHDGKIKVIENFLTSDRVSSAPRRRRFTEPGIRRVAIVSRLVPIKQIDLLLTCLERRPELNKLEFTIFGDGNRNSDYGSKLKQRAERNGLNVIFSGFRSDISQELIDFDLLLHLCSAEPFGLVILEAMAAGLPVLVPDEGGACSIVDERRTGLHFRANDPEALADALTSLQNVKPLILNTLAEAGLAAVATRFSESNRVADYRLLIAKMLGRPLN